MLVYVLHCSLHVCSQSLCQGEKPELEDAYHVSVRLIIQPVTLQLLLDEWIDIKSCLY